MNAGIVREVDFTKSFLKTEKGGRMPKKIQSLLIGGLEINPPIIQGGMGVRISRSGLASAVANEGGVGVIGGVGLGDYENRPGREFIEVNNNALQAEIRRARELSLNGGIIGVNLMVVLSNYDDLIGVAVRENIDLIISGAGLPLNLPALTAGTNIKLIPIVSSARTLKVLYEYWKRKHKRVPDAVVVEGVKAGGHLGFEYQEVIDGTAPDLDDILKEVIAVANAFEKPIPVIAAGGIFDGKDIARVLKLGASGVQMATRFVCTDECDVHINFKMAYVNAKKEDIVIMKSPVGLPGRVIRNKFVEDVMRGWKIPFSCRFNCLKTCDRSTAPFCIAKALANAAAGNLEDGFVFAGANAYRCTEIVPVKQLINELVEEAAEYL